MYFNPRSPRGGATTRQGRFRDILCLFQSTLPTRGRDTTTPSLMSCRARFQSTLPTRGSDGGGLKAVPRYDYFNPRSPRGGATASLMPSPPVIYISIHAPHEGERLSIIAMCFYSPFIFQSTLPTRGSDSGKVHLYAAFPRIC